MPKFFAALSLSLVSTFALAAKPCAADFEAFLVRFEAEPDFRQQNTRFPLTVSWVDSAARPEPKTVRDTIRSSADARYAKLQVPSAQEQVSMPFERKLRTQGANTQVQFTKPDTSYSLVFSFEKTPSCWRLTRFDDLSL